MTRTEARRALDTHAAAIDENVSGFLAGRIDYDTFAARQIAAHAAIGDAGQGDTWLRRQRRQSAHA